MLDVRKMVGEALKGADAILGPSDGPVKGHALHHLRMSDAESDDRTAAHAAAQEMGALEAQVIQQSPPLSDVVRPGDTLDAAARLAAFAPVEDNAGVFLGQVLEQLDPRVHTLRLPLVQGRIEPGGRVHQERRPVADHLVARLNAVDKSGRQVNLL